MFKILKPFLYAAVALLAFFQAIPAYAQTDPTPLTLILDDKDNAWGSITQDGIYRNGGFDYSPASPQWTSGHFQDTGYVQISTHTQCVSGMCQMVKDRNNGSPNDYWRKLIYRGTAIPAGGKAWVLNATVVVEAHNSVAGNHHGVKLLYTVANDPETTGYYSFSGLEEGVNTVVNQCVDIPLEYQSGSDYPSRVLVGRMKGTNIVDTGHYYVDEMTIHLINVPCSSYIPEGEPPPPPPPPSTGWGITATCFISLTTSTISDTETITQTESVTVPANLLNNASFELPVSDWWPEFWEASNPLYAYGMYRQGQPSDAYSGDDYMALANPDIGNSVSQPISLPIAPAWGYGAHVQQHQIRTDFFGNADPLILNLAHESFNVEADECSPYYDPTTGYLCAWAEYSATVTIPMSQAIFSVDFPALEGGEYRVDDAFLVPLNEAGGVHCPAVEEFYNGGNPLPTGIPPSSGYPPGTVGGIPVPQGGAGSTCYECRFPTQYLGTADGVMYAIAWLGCVLRNMFACSLRPWLWEISNATLGIFRALGILSNWLANNGQSGANWIGGMVQSIGTAVFTAWNQTPQTISIYISGASSSASMLEFIWMLIRGLFALFAGIVVSLIDALTYLLSLLWYVIQQIQLSYYSQPLTLQEWLYGADSIPDSGGYAVVDYATLDGYHDSKLLLWFVWGLAVVDSLFEPFALYWIVWIGCGVVVWRTSIWFIEQWRVIVPTI